MVLRMAKKPYILTLHGGNLPQFSRNRRWRVARLLRSAKVVTTPSRYLFEQMCPYHDAMVLLPNPLDIHACSFRLRSVAQPRLCWLRAFHSVYNPTLAVRVLHQLSQEFPDISLVMVGGDKGDGTWQEVQELAKKLGVFERLEMPGAVPKSEVPQWLQKGDIFLNTTNVDNTPVSVLEAMACGLCVVSTNVGGLPYLLTNEEDALLVPPQDVEAMVSAVRRFLTEADLAKRLSLNACKKAEQCDWNIVLPKWEKLLQEVAK